MSEFTLTLTNYSTDRQWSWELSSGSIRLTCHDVQLDPVDPNFEAFTNIQAYLAWRASPRTPQAVKSGVLDDLGKWITARFFGPVVEALCGGSPTVVNVVLLPAASHFASWPFELAWYDGGALAARGIVFTYEVARVGPSSADRTSVEAPLRILGVFALPAGHHPLNLRDERRQLERLFSQMSVDAGVDVRFSFVQYGVTRERLARVLGEPGGWDIVHISAHGVAGGLALESPDGSPDIIGSTGLLRLLQDASPRLRLLVLSSCSSAGAIFDRPHRQLTTPEARASVREPSLEVPVFGSVIADRVGCAVLAMRFPVSDSYATELSLHLYRHLIQERRPLTQALQAAVTDSSPGPDVLRRVTPVLLGSGCDRIAFRAARLPADPADRTRIIAGSATANLANTFVGRTTTVGRVIAALAPGGSAVAAVLYGMPGSGRTATAAEIAVSAAESFEDVVWVNLPADACPGQADSARSAAHLVSSRMAGDAGRRVLYVADDVPDIGIAAMLVESLPNTEGPRLLLTASQRAALPTAGVLWERVGSLSPEESALLIGECPNLQALLTAPFPDSVRSTALINVLAALAKGSPGLITLADAHAQSCEQIDEWIRLLSDQWHKETGQVVGAAQVGSPTVRLARRMLQWARRELALLPEPAADLLQTISGLEEGDRVTWFVRVVSLMREYGDDLTEELRDAQVAIVNDATEILCDRGLVLRLPQAGHDEAFYAIPTVVELAVQQSMAAHIAQDINVAAKAAWLEGISAGTGSSEHERGSLISHAYRSIVPYLLRLAEPDLALHFLNLWLNREPPSTSVTETLRLTRQIADAATTPATCTLAIFTGLRLQARADPASALREADSVLATLDDQELRAHVLSLKVTLLSELGQFEDALVLADENLAAAEKHPDARRLLDAEGVRLQVLHRLGRCEEAYERAQTLWLEMDSAKAALTELEGDPHLTWNSYEAILQAGAIAARFLDKYDESLAMNRARRRSLRERDAPPMWQANALYDDFLPLLKLQRVQEARQVLLEVLPVARAEGDRLLEASALGSLSEVELALEYTEEALQMATLSLTMLYDAGPFNHVQLITAHNRMAEIYRRLDRWPETFVHRLACVMLCMLTDSSNREELLRLATDLCYFRQPPLPTDTQDLTDKLTAMHSVDLTAVISYFSPDPQAGTRAYQQALTQARAVPIEELFPVQGIADIWGPAMAASAAAMRGDRKAHTWLHRILDSSGDEIITAFLQFADGRSHEVDPSTMSPVNEYILNITRDIAGGETHMEFAVGPPWEVPDLDVRERGMEAVMAFAEGDPYDPQAIASFLESLERGGSQALAQALRHFMSGERSRLLATGLPGDDATVIVDLIRIAQRSGRGER